MQTMHNINFLYMNLSIYLNMPIIISSLDVNFTTASFLFLWLYTYLL